MYIHKCPYKVWSSLSLGGARRAATSGPGRRSEHNNSYS